MKKHSGKLKTAGGAVLFLAAMASDGGALSLWATFLLALLALGLIAAGEILSHSRKKRVLLRTNPRRTTVSVHPAA